MEKVKRHSRNPKMKLNPKEENNTRYHRGFSSNIVFMIQKKKYGFLFFLKKKSTRPGVWITQSESLKLETKLSVILQAPEIKIIQ